jgi:transcriptional regulator with XRE-family HTH domain
VPSTPSSTSSRDDLYGRIIGALVLARSEAKISQTVLAERLGRPQSFVSKYEHQERLLDVAEFVEIAQAIGSDPIALLDDILKGAGGSRFISQRAK